jgi:hypothetical protein
MIFFSGGRSWSTRREPPTMGKQLVNFITCGCESNAPFFEFIKHQKLNQINQSKEVLVLFITTCLIKYMYEKTERGNQEWTIKR